MPVVNPVYKPEKVRGMQQAVRPVKICVMKEQHEQDAYCKITVTILI